MKNILDFVKQKFQEKFNTSTTSRAPINVQGLIDSVKPIAQKNIDNFKSSFGEYKANKEKESALRLIKLGNGAQALTQKIYDTPIIGRLAKVPEKFGTQSGELIAGGIKQIQAKTPSNLMGLNIPAPVAGGAKILGGVANLLPSSIVGNYAMDSAEGVSEPVFGKDSLATTGIALGAGLLAPSGTGKITQASKLVEEGTSLLNTFSKEKRLAFLMNYSDDLIRLGFKKNQVDGISAPLAVTILKNKISPAQWETLKSGKVISENKVVDSLSRAKNAFSEWVNSRRATQVEGFKKTKDFADLDEAGLAGFFEFQSGNNTGKFAKVKKFFDDKYIQMQNEGVEFGYKQNYLPQIWANTVEDIEKVFGKKLTQKPSFSLESVIKSYEEGVSAGLTPRFKNIGEISSWYESTANKAIADRKFFQYLTDGGLIQKDTASPNSWVTLDPDRFPKFKVSTDKGTFTGTYKAPKELADAINNYLSDPQGGLASYAKLSGALKNIYLTSGIPNSGANFHGVNILSRFVHASSNPISGFFTGISYLARPSLAEKFINNNLDDLTFAVKHGLNASSEEHQLQTLIKEVPTTLLGKGYEKLKEFHQKFFDGPLFSKIIPALKMKLFKANYEDLLKTHSSDEAANIASEITNNMLGGLNLDVLMRSKESQNILRSIFLASDWGESNIRIGGGIAKALINPNDPKGKAYRIFARNYLLSYLTLNITNKLLSGHYAFENQAGHQFELESGYTKDGMRRWIRPYGTSADFLRLPVDFVSGLAGGDASVAFRLVRNRLGPITGQALGQFTNTNWAGQKIVGQDDTVPEQIGKRIVEASSTFIPSYLSGPIKGLINNSGLEQTLMQTIEAPVRYSGGANNNLQKVAKEQTGATGEALYNQNEALKGQSLPDEYPKPEKFDWFGLLKKKEETEKTGIFKYVSDEQSQDLETKLIKSIVAKATTQEEAEKLLKGSGINKTFEEAMVPVIKGFTIENRAKFLDETLKASQDYTKTLDFYIEQKLVTNSLISEWGDTGVITPDEEKTLKNYVKVKNGGKIAKKKLPKIKIIKMGKGTSRQKLVFRKLNNYKPLLVDERKFKV